MLKDCCLVYRAPACLAIFDVISRLTLAVEIYFISGIFYMLVKRWYLQCQKDACYY